MEKCKCAKCGSIIGTTKETDVLTCYFCQSLLEIQRSKEDINGDVLDNEITYSTKIVDNGHYGVFFIAGGIFLLLLGFIVFYLMGTVSSVEDADGTIHYLRFNFEEMTKEEAYKEGMKGKIIAFALFISGAGLLYAGIRTMKRW